MYPIPNTKPIPNQVCPIQCPQGPPGRDGFDVKLNFVNILEFL